MRWLGLVLLLAGGCSAAGASPEEPASVGNDLTASSVRSIVSFDDDGAHVICDGTLIAPRVVLVPKDCAEQPSDGGGPISIPLTRSLSVVTNLGTPQMTRTFIDGVDVCLTPACNVAVYYLMNELEGVGSSSTAHNVQEEAFIQAHLVDPCGTENTYGHCEGDLAVRCTTLLEWPRRMTRNDCGAAALKCAPPLNGSRVSCE